MRKTQNNKIENHDFGFTASSTSDVIEHGKKELALEINAKNKEIVKLQQRLAEVKNLVTPILHKLKDSDDGSDKTAYIHWPNRRKVIEDQLDKISKA